MTTDIFEGVEADVFVDIVERIIVYFLSMTTKSKALRSNVQINIQLLKEHRYYLIQVTNCSLPCMDVTHVLNSIFLPLTTNELLPDNTVIAYLFSRTAEEDNEIVYAIKAIQSHWLVDVDTVDKELVNFPYLKEYLSIKLKYVLLPRNLEKFKELLIDKISVFQQRNPNVKFTFHHNKEIFCTNYVKSDDDFRNCQLLSAALTTMIKQSLNCEFRESCFKILQVDDSHDTESAIMNELLPMIQENYTG